MDWISVKKELPKITDEKSMVEVEVRTINNGVGKMTFGYSGAPGEPMTGSFWHPIRDFKGDVHLENEIIDWKHIESVDCNEPTGGAASNCPHFKKGKCNYEKHCSWKY